MKLKDLLSPLKGKYDTLSNEKLKNTEDFQETLKEMIRQAKKKSGKINKVRGKSFSDTIINYGNKLMLFYNDENKSTKVIMKEF